MRVPATCDAWCVILNGQFFALRADGSIEHCCCVVVVEVSTLSWECEKNNAVAPMSPPSVDTAFPISQSQVRLLLLKIGVAANLCNF